jgi:hypothetical protein
MTNFENKWYSAKDYRPPKSGRYLVACRGIRTAVVRLYRDGIWHSFNEVLYWLPLPRIPKGGADG